MLLLPNNIHILRCSQWAFLRGFSKYSQPCKPGKYNLARLYKHKYREWAFKGYRACNPPSKYSRFKCRACKYSRSNNKYREMFRAFRAPPPSKMSPCKMYNFLYKMYNYSKASP